jgi:nucleolar protein 9
MPRENRKRGKKHKKAEDEVHSAPVKEQREEEAPAPEPGPSWIKRRVDTEEQPQQNLDTPFGELEQDLKAYFRTVDVQMKQWLEEGYETLEADEDRDPNEGTHLRSTSMFG